MDKETLHALLKERATVEKGGIYVSSEIAEKTVWDKLAIENPTHAVISAKDEADAAKKSEVQIADIKQFLKSDDILLDCGTGYGRVAKYLLPKQPIGAYIGMDSSYEMLSLFKRRYSHDEAEQKTPLLLLNADMYNIPLKDNSVDVVIVCAVFLHNHKSIVAKAVTEIERVVKPGGKVLVYSSFPRSFTMMGFQGHAYQALLNLLGRPYSNGPVRYYRRKEIAKMFAGFSEVEYRPVGFSIIPKTIIGLPGPIEVVYRRGFANPLNFLLEKITPAKFKPFFAVHYDIVATR